MTVLAFSSFVTTAQHWLIEYVIVKTDHNKLIYY